MATKIVTKNSSTAGAAPTATDLVQGELAVNVADKRLFTEDNAGAIVELGTNPSGDVTFQDNGKAIFGAGSDLQIYHDGSDSVIAETGTGNLALWGNNIKLLNAGGTETMLDADPNGAVTLYYNDVTRLATSGAGIDVTGNISLPDNGKATFGAGDDLQIYHDGGNSVITNSTGNLIIRDSVGGNILIQGLQNQPSVDAIANGAVNLYYSGNEKLATTSTGIDVTGTATMDGLTVGDGHTIGDDNFDNLLIQSSSGEGIRLISNHATNPLTMESDVGFVFKTLFGTNRFEVTSTGNIKQNSVNTSTNVGYSVNNGTYDAIALGTGGFGVNGGAATDGGIRAYNNLLFGTGSSATQRMLIDSVGRVGIGTSSFINANAKLVVSNGTVDIEHYTDTGFGVGYVGTRSNHDFGLLTNGTPKLYITTAGNMGIGTSSPSGTYGTNLHVNSTATSSAIKLTNSSTGTGASDGFELFGSGVNTYLLNREAGFMYFGTSNTERMRIDSAGRVQIGTSTQIFSANLTVKNTASYTFGSERTGTGNEGHIIFKNGNGAVGTIFTNGSTTTYNTSSDQRLKENIADADDAGYKIDAIQVRKYDWKADGSHQDYGMIAQELQTVAPEAVSGDADSEEMMGVDYSKLVPMLIKEIQSLRNRVAQLETGE